MYIHMQTHNVCECKYVRVNKSYTLSFFFSQSLKKVFIAIESSLEPPSPSVVYHVLTYKHTR